MYSIYTDGGSSGNPGPGGWAFIVVKDDVSLYSSSGGEKETTNNKMELSAVINALKYVKDNKLGDVSLFSDSQYVIKGITEWIKSWKESMWKKGTVKNVELWEELDSLNSELSIKWNWVKGHNGNKYNEEADKLVKKESEKASLL